jgi:hypothetical protein
MPISDLGELLRSMEPVLNAGRYCFASLPHDYDLRPLQAIAMIHEPEGCSVILRSEIAAQHGIESMFEAAWITLTVNSDLAAVGLTAAFASALGQAGISCNVVAGAYHDHIFVPIDQAELAMQVLKQLQQH